MNFSYWEKEMSSMPADVLIAGAGIVGLSTAIELKQASPRLRIVVIDRGILPSGGSTKNAGFACFGSLSELADDFESMPDDDVFRLVKKRYDGLQNLRQLLGDNVIEYSACGGFELFRSKQDENLIRSLAIMQKMNAFMSELSQTNEVYSDASDLLKTFGFDGVEHLIVNKLEGSIHTGKMMDALRRKALEMGVDIQMGFAIEGIGLQNDLWEISTSQKLTFKAKQIVIATNAFAAQLLPQLDVVPGRAQVLVTSEIPGLQVKGTFHFDQGYFYFRNTGNRILLGGGRHLFKQEETTYQQTTSEVVQQTLEELLKSVIIPQKEFRIEHRWAGTLGLGENRFPIVKQLEPGLFAGVKMGGMGVAIGSLIGKELSELVLSNQ